MAIKISGTTVIDDTRNLTSINTTATGNVTVTGFVNASGPIQGKAHSIPDTSGSAQWVKLGTFTAGQGGRTIRVRAYIHQGYNALNNQDLYVDIFFKTSNGSNVDGNGFAGNSWYFIRGLNASNVTPKWKANVAGASATSFDLFLFLPVYTNNSHYIAEVDEDSIWTDGVAIGQTDPGSGSSTVCISSASFNITVGNVGIGNTDPAHKLRVDGTTSLAGAVSGITTLAAGNTTITGFSNVSGNGQFSGNVGIGIAPDSTVGLFVSKAHSATATTWGIVSSTSDANAALTAAQTKYGAGSLLYNYAQNKSGDGLTSYNSNYLGLNSSVYNGFGGVDARANLMEGVRGAVQQYSNGASSNSIFFARGVYGLVQNFGSGVISSAYGIHGEITAGNNSITGNITTAFGAYTSIISNTAMTIGTGYLYYGAHFGATTTTKYGMYLTGEQYNYFSGNVGIGNTTPAFKLRVDGTTSLAGAVSGITTLAAGNTTITGFANVTSTIQGGSSLAIAGALSGVTTAAMGNTTITGFANVSSNINAASFNVGATQFANTTGVYATFMNGKTEGNLNVNNATTAYSKTEGNLNVNNATTAYSATYATYHSSLDGDRDAATKLPTSTGLAVRFDFVSSTSAGTGGNYAGLMTYAPWTGTTASTGDASYQLAFGSTAVNGGGIPKLNIRKGIDSTWNAWYTLLHSGNYNDYSPTLTGTGASGTWAITANNATNLGGVAAASYVQNTDSRTLSGNINFTGTNNYFTGGTLGGTAGNIGNNITLVNSLTLNSGFLRFFTERNATGTDWTSASSKIQWRIDATNMGYIQFNPPNAAGNSVARGLAFGGDSTTEAMRVTATGNVGIGNTSPAHTLRVTGTTSLAGAVSDITTLAAGNTTITGFVNASTGSITSNGLIYSSNLILQEDGTHAYVRETRSGGHLYLGANNTNHVIIAANGNFGIGNTAPNELLVVEKSVNAAVAYTVRNPNTGVGSQVVMQIQSGLTSGLNMTVSESGAYYVFTPFGAAATAGYIDANTHVFRTAAGVEKVRIAANGNINAASFNVGATQFANTTGVYATHLGGTAAASYALLASPALSGTPTAPSAAAYTDTTQIATTAQVYDTVTTVPENAQTVTSYTLALLDAGKMVTLTNASAITLTIPTNATIPFPLNTRIDIGQGGAGQVTVGGAGVTIRSVSSRLKLTSQYSGATLWKKGTDEWWLIGDITT